MPRKKVSMVTIGLECGRRLCVAIMVRTLQLPSPAQGIGISVTASVLKPKNGNLILSGFQGATPWATLQHSSLERFPPRRRSSCIASANSSERTRNLLVGRAGATRAVKFSCVRRGLSNRSGWSKVSGWPGLGFRARPVLPAEFETVRLRSSVVKRVTALTIAAAFRRTRCGSDPLVDLKR
jgi:hypothetical protein